MSRLAFAQRDRGTRPAPEPPDESPHVGAELLGRAHELLGTAEAEGAIVTGEAQRVARLLGPSPRARAVAATLHAVLLHLAGQGRDVLYQRAADLEAEVSQLLLQPERAA